MGWGVRQVLLTGGGEDGTTGHLAGSHSAQTLAEKSRSISFSSQGANPPSNPPNIFFLCREQSQIFFSLAQSTAASSFVP